MNIYSLPENEAEQKGSVFDDANCYVLSRVIFYHGLLTFGALTLSPRYSNVTHGEIFSKSC